MPRQPRQLPQNSSHATRERLRSSAKGWRLGLEEKQRVAWAATRRTGRIRTFNFSGSGAAYAHELRRSSCGQHRLDGL